VVVVENATVRRTVSLVEIDEVPGAVGGCGVVPNVLERLLLLIVATPRSLAQLC